MKKIESDCNLEQFKWEEFKNKQFLKYKKFIESLDKIAKKEMKEIASRTGIPSEYLGEKNEKS